MTDDPHARAPSHPRRLAGPETAVALLALLLWSPGVSLVGFTATGDRLPQWDQAKYAVSGLRLAGEVSRLDPLGFAARIHELSAWPPTYPLLEMPVLLLAGPAHTVPRTLVAVLWVLTLLAAWWASRRILPELTGSSELRTAPGQAEAVGLLAAAWLAAGPLFQALGTVNLLEIPGLLLLLLALGCYLRALEGEIAQSEIPEIPPPDSPGPERPPSGAASEASSGPSGNPARWWSATWAASLALFLCKYNYGLLWLVPLGLAEAHRRCGSWSAVGRIAYRRLLRVRWRRPWPWVVVAVLLVVSLIRLTGGIDAEILGQRLRATSAGNPLYALYLLAVLRLGRRLLWGGPESRRRFRQRLARLDRAGHGAVRWLLAPLGLWFLLPPHLKDFAGFVENRSSDLPLTGAEAWLFYPRALGEAYAPLPWLGGLAMVLAAVGLVAGLRGRAEAPHRLLALLLGIQWAALILHPYKLPRFAVSAALLTGLMAAVVLVRGVAVLGRRLPGGPGLPAWGLAGTAVLLTGWAGLATDTVTADHHLRTVPAEAGPVVERVVDHAAREGGVLVLGTWNHLSPWLLEWCARARRWQEGSPAGAGTADVRPPATWRDLVGSRDPEALRGRLTSGCPVRWVVALESDHPLFALETAWLEPVTTWLAAAPGWILEEERRFPEAGYRLRLYRCAV